MALIPGLAGCSDDNSGPNPSGPNAPAQSGEAKHGPTFPARKPRQTIDHVLHAPEVVVVSTSVERTPMSDHAALIVDFG